MGRANARIELRSAFLGGLIAALLVTAAPAIADVGDALLAGKFNTVDKKTTISGSAAGDSMFKVANQAGDGTGITVQVEPGNPPFVVDSAKRVKKLNADKLDGHHADDFVMVGDVGVFAAAQIRSDGSIRNGTDRVVAVTTPITGAYCIEFSESASQTRLESAVVGQAGSSEVDAFPKVTNGQAGNAVCPSGNLHIEINDVDGTLVAARFSFIVP